jgi:hypothetical protein
VATALAALRADDVDAEVEALLDVLGVADHVHVQDASLVQLLDDGLGGHPDGANEQLGAGVDDDVDELVQLALGVVVAVSGSAGNRAPLVGGNVLGLSRASTNLREEQIDAKWRALVVQISLELGDLLAEHVWRVANATQHTDTAGIGDSRRELRPSSHVHASKHDGVLDLQQVGELGADLLCGLLAERATREPDGDVRGEAMMDDV